MKTAWVGQTTSKVTNCVRHRLTYQKVSGVKIQEDAVGSATPSLGKRTFVIWGKTVILVDGMHYEPIQRKQIRRTNALKNSDRHVICILDSLK